MYEFFRISVCYVKMQFKTIILRLWLSFWLFGQTLGVYGPSFGVAKTLPPLQTSPTPPSGKILYTGAIYFSINMHNKYTYSSDWPVYNKINNLVLNLYWPTMQFSLSHYIKVSTNFIILPSKYASSIIHMSWEIYFYFISARNVLCL